MQRPSLFKNPSLVWTAALALFLLPWCDRRASSTHAQTASAPGLGPRGDLKSIAFEETGAPVLRGRNARRQLVVTGVFSSGQRHDLSRDVQFQVDNPQVLTVDTTGLTTPVADGEATITAVASGGLTAQLKLTTQQCATELPVNFPNEIVPIFTKLGCNAGGCHGKSDGQNGFKLSLLGFYPEDDYEYLVYEDRGRRIFPADPQFSLLLQKPANQLPHGGGMRMSPGSYQWQLMTSWIEQGMPYGADDDPTIARIEVFPPAREMNMGSQQQLAVVAHYSDGSQRDVTRLASYEANDGEMAEAAATGVIAVGNVPGEAPIMIRFQGQVTVFRAIIPQGSPVTKLPPEQTYVDRHVFAKLKQLGIPPSELCDDGAFIRRVTVDLTGRLPTAAETSAFIANAAPQKRAQLVDQLLESPGYGDYFANKWSAVLRNKRRNANDIPYTFRFHSWIRQALQENMPYDEFARNILAATGDVETHPPAAWYREVSTAAEQMEDTAQLFLGIRIQCARCHHHPFERWSQNDYFSFEAFFSQVQLKRSRFNPVNNQNDQVTLKVVAPSSKNPRTGETVAPTGLGGQPLEIAPYADARHDMVDWMAAPDNPFFARALANRYWKHFFGRGIVDPEDDLRVTNPPSNPELLDALAKSFIDSRFDLKQLIRDICRSSAYQLSSDSNEFNQSDRQNFSSFYPRRLPAEVLYDAIDEVSQVTSNFGTVPQGTRAVQLPDNGFNNYFLEVFGKPESNSACECERSAEANLAQSLHLLNSSDVTGKIAAGGGRAATLAADQERDTAAKIGEIYLAAFARSPRPEELERVEQFLSESPNLKQGFEDLLWAVFNTKEFQFVR